jgi:hypothetical protein
MSIEELMGRLCVDITHAHRSALLKDPTVTTPGSRGIEKKLVISEEICKRVEMNREGPKKGGEE